MSNFNKVKTFMKTFGQEVKTKPSFSTDKINSLRYGLIEEELEELKIAMKNKDLLEVADALTDICIAVGKTSFVDWDLFTWSFGWTGVFEPFFPFSISIALLAITSLTFILVWVPEPVCQTFKGKFLSNFPLITSSEAFIIELVIVLFICLSL